MRVEHSDNHGIPLKLTYDDRGQLISAEREYPAIKSASSETVDEFLARTRADMAELNGQAEALCNEIRRDTALAQRGYISTNRIAPAQSNNTHKFTVSASKGSGPTVADWLRYQRTLLP